jgi:cyclic pyranopterin phosphate synthase
MDDSDSKKTTLTHVNSAGEARMVDVSAKQPSVRVARATGMVVVKPETLRLIEGQQLKKGDALQLARIAGIMAAKRTADLIPLCHPLPIESVEVDVTTAPPTEIRIEATVGTTARTGVEMEALTAVSVAALTIYDMCKSVDRAMSIGQVVLEEKTGGTGGDYHRFQNF